MKIRSKVTLALAWGLSLLVLPSFAASKGSGLQTAGYSISGNSVVVKIANSGTVAKSGSVIVEVVLDGNDAASAEGVQVPAGGSATVTVAFPVAVDGVILVGITDDVSPF